MKNYFFDEELHLHTYSRLIQKNDTLERDIFVWSKNIFFWWILQVTSFYYFLTPYIFIASDFNWNVRFTRSTKINKTQVY